MSCDFSSCFFLRMLYNVLELEFQVGMCRVESEFEYSAEY